MLSLKFDPCFPFVCVCVYVSSYMYTLYSRTFSNLYLLDVWITLHVFERYNQITWKCFICCFYFFFKDTAVNGNPERNIYSYKLLNTVGLTGSIQFMFCFQFYLNPTIISKSQRVYV